MSLTVCANELHVWIYIRKRTSAEWDSVALNVEGSARMCGCA